MAVAELEVDAPVEKAARVAPYVIAADQHVNPLPAMWEDYLPQRARHLAPKLERGDEFDYVVFEGTRKKVSLLGATAGRDGKQFKVSGKLSDARTGGWMAPTRIADMDADGIDVAVLFGGGPLGTASLDLYLDSFTACTRWLADFCSHDPKRLISVGYIPMFDVDLSISLVREAHAMGMKAINIPAFPQNPESLSRVGRKGAQTVALTGDQMGSRQYRDPEFDPFWAICTELDMAVTFHLGARGARFDEPENFLSDLSVGKVVMIEPIAIMIYGGVFDRHPTLRLGAIESGSGWLPWAAEYMDRTWQMQRHWAKNNTKEKPSFYFDRNIYMSFIDDKISIKLRDMPGGKNIMWTSDYPHSEMTFPHSQVAIVEHFKDVSTTDRDWIVAGCAREFYALDI